MHVNDVTVTAAQKIIKNSNHSYVCNILRIKSVKSVYCQFENPAPAGFVIPNPAKSGSGRIGKQ